MPRPTLARICAEKMDGMFVEEVANFVLQLTEPAATQQAKILRHLQKDIKVDGLVTQDAQMQGGVPEYSVPHHVVKLGLCDLGG